MKLSWKPIAKGNKYCSPACGGGCTKLAYLQAKKEAAVCKKLLGKKWKVHIWENLGWCWAVECFPFSVRGNRSFTGKMFYYAMTCDDRAHLGAGSYLWQGKSIESIDPRKVIRHEVQRIEYTVGQLLELRSKAIAALFK